MKVTRFIAYHFISNIYSNLRIKRNEVILLSKKNIFNVMLLVLSTLFVVVKSISDNAYLLSDADETE